MRRIDFDTEENAYEFRMLAVRQGHQVSWPFRNTDGGWSVTIR
jgi:hypothetical protein